jgi:hypothetical protein
VRLLRRLFGLVTLVAVAVGAAVVVRRRVTRPQERVDLYYEDGSMTSFEPDSPEAGELFALAREALAAARAG